MTIEVTRAAIPGTEPWKRPLAKVSDKPPAALPPLEDRLGGSRQRSPAVGWAARLGRFDRRSANRHRRALPAASCGFPDPGDDADRCRRLSSAGRAGGRRRGRGGQGDPPPRHRRVDRDRPADRAKQGRSPGRGGGDRRGPAPAVRADRGQRLRLRPDRPAARSSLIARAGAGPRRVRGPRPAAPRGVREAAAPSGSSRIPRWSPRSKRSRTGSKRWRAKSAARSACAPIPLSPCRAGMPSKPKAKNCPICGKPEQPEQAPFCSRGCKDRDLLKWLGEGYRIPGPPADPGRVDSERGRRLGSALASSGPAGPAAIAQVAQLVEHVTENHGVGGSIPSLGTIATLATCR